MGCVLQVSLVSGYVSDRFQRRGITAAFFAAMCALGFIIFFSRSPVPSHQSDLHAHSHIVSDNTTVRYLSLYLAVPGSFCAVPAVGAWTANNVAPYTRRGVVISLISITSSLGGFLSPWILGSWSTPPKYAFATVCFILFSTCQTLCALANLQYVIVENRKKALRREQIGREEDEEPGLGDRSAWFIYSQ
jgi:MFS family permease